jgi:hypothetical protein
MYGSNEAKAVNNFHDQPGPKGRGNQSERNS